MRADLVGLGMRLGWVAADEKEELALEKVRSALREDGEGILLIYDNAIDAANLRPYLLAGGSARALVTSNSPAWRGVATVLEIQLWPKQVGGDYLIARTGRANERSEAEALSEALGGLALAHEQAGAYCDRLGLTLAEYCKRFSASPAPLLDAIKDAPGDYHSGLTVAKAFALAIDEASKLHPAAEQLIYYSAVLAPEPIPLFLFSEGRGKFGQPFASQIAEVGLDEAVAALRAFSLVGRETIADDREPSITTDTIRLHRLVRAAAIAKRGREGVEAARRTLLEVMTAIYPRSAVGEAGVWPRARMLDGLAFTIDMPSHFSSVGPPKGANQPHSFLVSSQIVRPPMLCTSSIMWRVPPGPSPPLHSRGRESRASPRRSAKPPPASSGCCVRMGPHLLAAAPVRLAGHGAQRVPSPRRSGRANCSRQSQRTSLERSTRRRGYKARAAPNGKARLPQKEDRRRMRRRRCKGRELRWQAHPAPPRSSAPRQVLCPAESAVLRGRLRQPSCKYGFREEMLREQLRKTRARSDSSQPRQESVSRG
jgi:hypothetical protein